MNKCMLCNNTIYFGSTSLIYKGKLLKYCQNCEHEIIYQTIIKKEKENGNEPISS